MVEATRQEILRFVGRIGVSVSEAVVLWIIYLYLVPMILDKYVYGILYSQQYEVEFLRTIIPFHTVVIVGIVFMVLNTIASIVNHKIISPILLGLTSLIGYLIMTRVLNYGTLTATLVMEKTRVTLIIDIKIFLVLVLLFFTMPSIIYAFLKYMHED